MSLDTLVYTKSENFIPRKMCGQIKDVWAIKGIEKLGSHTLMGLIFLKISLFTKFGQIREKWPTQTI